jgi:hypothetical protein
LKILNSRWRGNKRAILSNRPRIRRHEVCLVIPDEIPRWGHGHFARTIPPERLYERRKQAIALRKKGMSSIEITKIVGVRRDVFGRWYAMWQEGGKRALKVSQAGTPRGSSLRLNTLEQERIRKSLIKDVGRKIILILDNLRVHHTRFVKE